MKPDDVPSPASLIVPAGVPRAARVFLALLRRLARGRLDLVTPEGALLAFESGAEGPQAVIRLGDWRVLTEVMRRGDIGFAEAWMAGRWETPDLAELLTLAALNHQVLEAAVYGRWWGWAAYRLRHLVRSNRRRQARRNIQAHYDLGNEFYGLWLDAGMTYSSALFGEQPGQSLQDAQTAKYERICRVLDIREGDRVLEIGCGWGGFAEHAAGTRRCRVHGLTLSEEQLLLARRRVAAAGLSERVALELRDYRDMRGEFDHVVSIEMFEAVGEAYWPDYFRCVRERLRPGGRAMVQTIHIADALFARYRTGTDFIQQYVFPGGMLPSMEVFRRQARGQGLDVADAHEFGMDYALTLRHWRYRFNRRAGDVSALGFDQRFLRLWNFYLAYCEAGFRAGTLGVSQVELRRG